MGYLLSEQQWWSQVVYCAVWGGLHFSKHRYGLALEGGIRVALTDPDAKDKSNPDRS